MKPFESPAPDARTPHLEARRNLKMARSAHAYVRGNTIRFYEWLDTISAKRIPVGPPVWICGDCHVGNLGPVGSVEGDVEIEIRDLDQTVIGNPIHDLIRLGLSLATAARGSDLPGVVTARIIEALMEGYEAAIDINVDDDAQPVAAPDVVKFTMKRALGRRWRNLAEERIEDSDAAVLRGPKFWMLSDVERQEVTALFEQDEVRSLITRLNSRPDDAQIKVVDSAYWIKGCSSLGRLRYSVLLKVGEKGDRQLCLVDIKEALRAAAPRARNISMPKDNAKRVVTGAMNLSPYLGERMLPARIQDTPVFIRELLPQDLKLDIDTLTPAEARKSARYLAWVVGKAHARQMDTSTRKAWLAELARNRSESLDAPTWLWRSVVELVASHEAGYLDHCRLYALTSVT
ncbi:MAG TPA: DUF2252 family protein [Hyphomonadaceae bacterium]|jgi:uncharacterized protein (DUF2252 family)|nr:DUF2252 family protein [Hyphomonadaceae bacterium]